MAPSGGATGATTIPGYVSQYQSVLMGNVKVTNYSGTDYAAAATDASNIQLAIDDNLNLVALMNTASGLNPFTGVAAFDPDTVLGEIDEKCLAFLDLVQDLEPEEVLETAVRLATEQADLHFLDQEQIDAAVRAFELRGQEAFQRSASRTYSSMLGSRAVMTGMFDNVVAYMENQRQAEVNDYDAKIRLTQQDQRYQFISTTAQNLIALVGQQLEAFRAATELRMKTGAMHIAAKNDQITQDMALDKNEVLWTLDMFPTYAAGMISSYTGGVPSSREMTTGDKIMAGLFAAGQLFVGAAPLLAKLK